MGEKQRGRLNRRAAIVFLTQIYTVRTNTAKTEDTERGTAAYSISLRSVIAIITRNRGGSKRDWEGTSDARDRFDPPRFSPTFSFPFFSPISPPISFFHLLRRRVFFPRNSVISINFTCTRKRQRARARIPRLP